MDTTNKTSGIQPKSDDLEKSMSVGDVVFERFKITGVIEQRGDLIHYSAQDLSNSSLVSIKCLESKRENLRLDFIGFHQSKALKHKNIAEPIEFHTSEEGYPAFIASAENKVSLKDIVSGSGPIEQEEEILFVLQQLAEALEHAHASGTYHGGIKPEDVSLAQTEENEVLISVDNFRFDLQTKLKERNFGLRLDLYCLASIAFYIASGIESNEVLEDLDTIPTIKELDTIKSIRPDLLCLDEFVQLLEDATSGDASHRIETVQEFKDGLLDWIEAVKATNRTVDATVLSKVKKSSDGTINTPTTKDLSSVVKHITDLRRKQSDQEESMVIKLTDLASSGARRSPTMTATRITMLACAWVLILGGVALVWLNYPREIETAWKATSKNIYMVIKLEEAKNEEITMASLPESQIKTVRTTKNKEAVVKHQQTNDSRGRKNLLPKFDPTKLHNIYHRKAGLANNSDGKTF